MEPISAIATVYSVYQVASFVGTLVFRYVRGVQTADSAAASLLEEIQQFQNSLVRLNRMLQEEGSQNAARKSNDRLSTLREIMSAESPLIKNSTEELERIRSKLEADERGHQSLKDLAKTVIRRATWPLKEEDIRRTIDTMHTIAAQIDRAQSIDTTQMVRSIEKTTKEISATSTETNRAVVQIKNLMTDKEREEERKKNEELRNKILAWLQHPDPQENHNIACAARNEAANTGSWFIEGEQFANWKQTPRSVLWLHGDPGCGKTVLAATIIESLRKRQLVEGRVALAYWYFNANDKSRTNLEKCVLAMLSQWTRSFSDQIPEKVKEFFRDKREGQDSPKKQDVLATLRKLLNSEKWTFYLVLDALDECREADHAELLEVLHSFSSLDHMDVHTIVTSRPVVKDKYRERMNDTAAFFDIAIEREIVNIDIKAHVHNKLENDPELNRWNAKVREDMAEKLTFKADGSFRLVDCQLNDLRKCKKRNDVYKVLESLSKDLNETYSRDLANVGESDQDDVLNLLKYLAFPQRKLQLREAAHLLAVHFDAEPEPWFDPGATVEEPEMLLELCGSLFRKDVNPEGRNHLGELDEVVTITTYHATVQEFLILEPIKVGNLPETRLDRATVNMQMALTCLGYLNTLFDEDIEWNEDMLSDYPCARLCAEFWDDYYRAAIQANPDLDMARVNKLIIKLLDNQEHLLKYIQLCDPNHDERRVNLNLTSQFIESPVYYASVLGLPDVLEHYIEQGGDVNFVTRRGFGTSLGAAAFYGWSKVTQILLAAGADPTITGVHWWGQAIAVAIERDQAEIVKLLIQHPKVDINSIRDTRIDLSKLAKKSVEADSQEQENGDLANSTEANGHDEAISTENDPQDESVSTKDKGEEEGEDSEKEEEDDEGEDNAAADEMSQSVNGVNGVHKEETEDLTEAQRDDENAGDDGNEEDADDDDDDDDDDSSSVASVDDNPDPSTQDVAKEGLVTIAAMYDSPESLTVLLEAGADPNITGGEKNDALQAACDWPRDSMVKQLLDHGARVDLTGGNAGSSLIAACHRGVSTELIRRMIDSGADVNYEGSGRRKTALVAASEVSNVEVVELLLEKGANPNVNGCDPYENALQAACFNGNMEITKLLLAKGADKHWKGEENGESALYAAASTGKAELVRLLLDEGCDPNIEGGLHTHPLHTALIESQGDSAYDEAIELLLEYGADVNLPMKMDTDETRYPIQTHKMTVRAVEALLSHGADINQRGNQFASPIGQAIISKDLLRVDYLLGRGVDPNKYDEDYGYPLALAVENWDADIVQTFIGKADIDAFGKTGSALHAAAVEKNIEAIDILLANGADARLSHWLSGSPLAVAVSARDNRDMIEKLWNAAQNTEEPDLLGMTALHISLICETFDAADQLLGYGFKMEQFDKLGRNALHLAALAATPNFITKAITHGIDVNLADNHGWTPLHWAAGSNYGTSKTIMCLLEAGADKTLLDEDGNSAADLAFKYGFPSNGGIVRTGGAILPLYVDDGNNLMRVNHPWDDMKCDACRQQRGNGFKCKTCSVLFYLCFRCIKDKDVAHFPGHEFELKVEEPMWQPFINPEQTDRLEGTLTKMVWEEQDDQWHTFKKGIHAMGHILDGRDEKSDRFWVSGDGPYTATCPYFEVEIVTCGTEAHYGVQIGFCTSPSSKRGLCGWEEGTWAYHSDNGGYYFQKGSCNVQGETYTEGDVIGCGIDPFVSELDPSTRAIFFTKNGRHQGAMATTLREDTKLWPVVSAVSPLRRKVRFKVNLGEQDFVWKRTKYEPQADEEDEEEEARSSSPAAEADQEADEAAN